MGAGAVQVDEENLIREKIAELTLPVGVKFKRIEQFDDWTGDPAVRIYFSVSRRVPLKPKFLKELSAITFQLRESVLSLGFDDAR